MNVSRLSAALCAAVVFSGLTSLQAQFPTIGITGELRPVKWTLDAGTGASTPGQTAFGLNGASVGFGPESDGDYPRKLIFTGPNVAGGVGEPVRMTATITLPSDTGHFAFNYAFETDDSRGWGDNATVPTHYEKAGYILDGVEYILTPNGDTAGGAGMLAVVDVDPSEYFTFFFESLDTDMGGATFTLDYIHTAVVPEPGEWMALAGVGMMGFAGVRRWRQNKAASL